MSPIHAVCKLLTIHPRQRDIRNHQIETTRSRFTNSQSLVTTICQKNLVPVASQYCAKIPQHGRFVVDDRDGHGIDSIRSSFSSINGRIKGNVIDRVRLLERGYTIDDLLETDLVCS
jgi:hypothetical protein